MPHSPLESLEIESPEAFVKRLNLHLNTPNIITRALTHRSYVNEHPETLEDNERLEFLGDAVLDFLVGEWLYHHMPEMPEGRLTSLRAALVRNEQLAEFARLLKLGSALRLGRGEDESGGRERFNLLGSAFEALVGAIYVDRGLQAVRDFIEPMLEKAVAEILNENLDRDAKSILQEYTQSSGMGTPAYRTISVNGPDHQRVYEVEVVISGEVYGRGQGANKQAATKSAAQAALCALGLKK
jgi:ribonuclease III